MYAPVVLLYCVFCVSQIMTHRMLGWVIEEDIYIFEKSLGNTKTRKLDKKS